jgi:hypothetical protein
LDSHARKGNTATTLTTPPTPGVGEHLRNGSEDAICRKALDRGGDGLVEFAQSLDALGALGGSQLPREGDGVRPQSPMLLDDERSDGQERILLALPASRDLGSGAVAVGRALPQRFARGRADDRDVDVQRTGDVWSTHYQVHARLDEGLAGSRDGRLSLDLAALLLAPCLDSIVQKAACACRHRRRTQPGSDAFGQRLGTARR